MDFDEPHAVPDEPLPAEAVVALRDAGYSGRHATRSGGSHVTDELRLVLGGVNELAPWPIGELPESPAYMRASRGWAFGHYTTEQQRENSRGRVGRVQWWATRWRCQRSRVSGVMSQP